MKRLSCLPLLLAAPAFCADDALLNLLPADTQIVIGARVRAIVDSDLARSLAPAMQNNPQLDWQKIVDMAGFDPLHDIDEVFLASTGQGAKAPGLIVARGKFPVDRVAAAAELYHGVPLLATKAQGAGVFAFPDGTTALAGDEAMVKAAIDRRGSSAALPPALASQIADYRARYEIWGIVNRPEGLAGYLPPSKQASPLDSIDRLQFGVALKDGLNLFAELHARSLRDADQLAATLQFVAAMSQAQQPASPGTRFDVKNNQGTIRISVAVSAEDLKKAIESQSKAGMLHATAPAPRPAQPVHVQIEDPVAPPPAPAPPVQPARAQQANGGTGVFTLPGSPGR